MPAFEERIRPQLPELPKREAIEAVIAAARATAVAAALQKAEEEARELAKAEEKAKLIEKKQARKEKEKKPSMSKEEKEALKEKNLKKMVGAIVVKTMSKYQKYLGHDQFKKYAKEVRYFLFRATLTLLTCRHVVNGGHCRKGEEVFEL